MSNRSVPVVCGILTIGLLIAFMHRDYPSVGRDFVEFVPRLVDTELYIRANGFGPQLYTPSFGGGLPAFANPQHVQYSIIQLFFLLTGAWSAVLLSTALISAVGFAASYVFFRRTIGVSVVASTLGAMSVVANGFYIQHISGGHVGFQLFPLIGVFAMAATRPQLSILTASVVCGMAAATVVHGGGALIAVLIAGSLLIAFQVTHLLLPSAIDWKRLTSIALLAAVIAVALAASKLYAVNALMSHFPRELSDRYDIGLLHGLFGLGSQLAGGMMIIPILFAGRFPPQRLDDALVGATGSGVHVSELDVSVQPVLMIAVTIAAARWLWLAFRRSESRDELQVSRIGLALLFVTIWIAVETTLARGIVYPWLHQLPFFRSMHVNHRVAAVFILPITIVGTLAINAWQPHRRAMVSAALLALALLFQLSYELLPEQFYRRWFDISEMERIQQRVLVGERFPITRMDEVPDDRVFTDHVSSRVPYDPLFGYDGEHFKSELTNGPVDTVRDGRFNFTNPASLLFPELLGMHPFERIRQDDADNLRRLIERGVPDWPYPPILDWLNRLAVATLAFCIAVLARALIRKPSTAHADPR